jgi:hypothetical protein
MVGDENFSFKRRLKDYSSNLFLQHVDAGMIGLVPGLRRFVSGPQCTRAYVQHRLVAQWLDSAGFEIVNGEERQKRHWSDGAGRARCEEWVDLVHDLSV